MLPLAKEFASSFPLRYSCDRSVPILLIHKNAPAASFSKLVGPAEGSKWTRSGGCAVCVALPWWQIQVKACCAPLINTEYSVLQFTIGCTLSSRNGSCKKSWLQSVDTMWHGWKRQTRAATTLPYARGTFSVESSDS